jgi:hypothetical protein
MRSGERLSCIGRAFDHSAPPSQPFTGSRWPPSGARLARAAAVEMPKAAARSFYALLWPISGVWSDAREKIDQFVEKQPCSPRSQHREAPLQNIHGDLWTGSGPHGEHGLRSTITPRRQSKQSNGRRLFYDG